MSGPLRELLHRRLQELSDEAAKHDGDVPAEQLDSLNRLARLVEVREKTFPYSPPRWRIAAVLAGTLLLVSLLLFLRVRETSVELQLVVSEVGFVLARPQVLTDLVNLAELSVSGLRDVQAVRVTAMERPGKSGTVTLNPLNLADGVEIHVYGSRAGCRVVLNGSHTPIRATMHGPVRVELQSSGASEDVFEMPKALVLEPDPGEVSLDLRPAANSAIEFSPQLSIRKLALSRIDEFQALEGTTADTVSTIVSGALYLESLNGESRPIRSRELLRFDEIRGVIRTLQAKDGQVALAFRGTVRGMRSGWGENPSSLMPTWLEWLRARHGLSLLWGTTLYLFGLAAAILRWWRVPL